VCAGAGDCTCMQICLCVGAAHARKHVCLLGVVTACTQICSCAGAGDCTCTQTCLCMCEIVSVCLSVSLYKREFECQFVCA